MKDSLQGNAMYLGWTHLKVVGSAQGWDCHECGRVCGRLGKAVGDLMAGGSGGQAAVMGRVSAISHQSPLFSLGLKSQTHVIRP